MFKRKLTALFDGKKSKIYYQFTDYDNISRNMKLAVIASEDQKFNHHHGFDFEAIDKAMKQNKKRKKIKGASTLTQQTAKNVFLWDSRNFIRKGLEAYFTVLIEILWSKERILEVYLNVAEMGPMTFGCEAAAKKYYQKSAKNINKDEAAMIAAILPNPILFKAKAPTKFILKRKFWIMSQMNALGFGYLKEL